MLFATLPPQEFQGPLPVIVQDPFANLGFTLEPATVHALRQGERAQAVALDTGANTYYKGLTNRYIYADAELHTLRLGERWGTSRGEWSAQLRITERSGGVLDGFLAFWHKHVVPFNDPVFSKVRHNQVQLVVADRGNPFFVGGYAIAPTALTLGYKRELRPGLAARAVVKLPIAGRRDYLDNGALDLAAGLLAAHSVSSRFMLHGNINLVRAGTTSVGGFQKGDRYLIGGVLAGEYGISPRTTLVVQAEDSAFPFFRHVPPSGARRQQMSFGAWHQLSSTDTLHASFSENIYPFRVTAYAPDVMLSLGLVRRR